MGFRLQTIDKNIICFVFFSLIGYISCTREKNLSFSSRLIEIFVSLQANNNSNKLNKY